MQMDGDNKVGSEGNRMNDSMEEQKEEGRREQRVKGTIFKQQQASSRQTGSEKTSVQQRRVWKSKESIIVLDSDEPMMANQMQGEDEGEH